MTDSAGKRTRLTLEGGSAPTSRGGAWPAPGKRTLVEGLARAPQAPSPPASRSRPAPSRGARNLPLDLSLWAGPTPAGPGPAPTRGTQPQPKPPQHSPESSRIDRLIFLLATTPPARGIADWDEAYAFLNGLSLADLLTTVSGAADCGYLPALLARWSGAKAYDGAARMLSVVYVVELARTAPSSVTSEQLNRAGVLLDQIPREQQLQIFAYILNHRGLSVAATTLMEGVVAMREREITEGTDINGRKLGPGAAPGAAGGGHAAGGAPASAVGPAAATTAGPLPVEPGAWAPPGDQPIPLYIGNEAHSAIARNYVAAHKNDLIRTNHSPLLRILRALEVLGHSIHAGALSDSELDLMPDITNLSRLHLYEIKPLSAQPLAAAKARLYLGLLARAGVAMALGPTSEPGTSGGVSAPGGVYMFWSPEPGVIVYQYRRGRLVPVPVAEPQPEIVRRWQLQLQPLTPQQRAAVTTTTLGGAMLIAMMLLLSPFGI